LSLTRASKRAGDPAGWIRLERDSSYLGTHGLGHGVGRHVGLTRDGPQDGQALAGDPVAVLTEQVGRVGGHTWTLSNLEALRE
jgi:hypothetical protein